MMLNASGSFESDTDLLDAAGLDDMPGLVTSFRWRSSPNSCQLLVVKLLSAVAGCQCSPIRCALHGSVQHTAMVDGLFGNFSCSTGGKSCTKDAADLQ